MAHQLFPFWRQTLDVLFSSRPVGGVALLSVEKGDAGYPHIGYGLQIGGNSRFADAAVEKVEPCLGIVDFVGLAKR